MSGTVFTLPFTNVFYLKLTDDGTQTSADLKTIVDAVINAYHTRMTAVQSSSVTITDAKATWITGSGTALEYENSYSLVSTGGTAMVDTAAAIVLNLAINQYYRGGHPRLYLPGVISANVTNGSALTSAYQSSIATAANSWLADCNALTGVHVSSTQIGTVSFARSNAWRTPPVFYKWQSAGVRNIMGTQRRRLGGR